MIDLKYNLKFLVEKPEGGRAARRFITGEIIIECATFLKHL